jgi:hypothetical protein
MVTSELAFPVCFHVGGAGLPSLSKRSNEKTNAIACGVVDSVH